MNFVLGILALWIGGALFYLAIDPTKVSSAMTGKTGQAKQAGLGHGSAFSLYTDLLQPFGATNG